MSSPLITPALKAQFERDGFLVVNDILSDADLQVITADYAAKLDEMATAWQAEGKVADTCAGLPFGERLTKLAGAAKIDWSKPLDISLPQANVKPDTPIHTSKAIFDLIVNPRLLDVVEEFVGPEIYSNPIQHTRIKPPERLLAPEALKNGLAARVGWHQDQGVATTEQDEVPVLTVWLAITDASEENGCLCVVPGSHAKLLDHCPGPGAGAFVEIPTKLIARPSVAAPVRRGGAILMHRRTVHSSLENRSNGIRWSFDLRYQPTGLPTGRPAFPGFVARSRRQPGSELKDWRQWAKLWHDTRARLAAAEAPKFNRWNVNAPVCA